MEFGARLPAVAFEEPPRSAAGIARVAALAEELGFTTLCANDHLVYSMPWLDAVALGATRRTTLMLGIEPAVA